MREAVPPLRLPVIGTEPLPSSGGDPDKILSPAKGNLLAGAEVGDPVPSEQALDGHDDIGAKGCEGLQEALGIIGDLGAEDDVVGLVIDHADGQEPGVEIDTAIESVLMGIEAHSHGLLGLGGT
jgi:hypothetical protein